MVIILSGKTYMTLEYKDGTTKEVEFHYLFDKPLTGTFKIGERIFIYVSADENFHLGNGEHRRIVKALEV